MLEKPSTGSPICLHRPHPACRADDFLSDPWEDSHKTSNPRGLSSIDGHYQTLTREVRQWQEPMLLSLVTSLFSAGVTQATKSSVLPPIKAGRPKQWGWHRVWPCECLSYLDSLHRHNSLPSKGHLYLLNKSEGLHYHCTSLFFFSWKFHSIGEKDSHSMSSHGIMTIIILITNIYHMFIKDQAPVCVIFMKYLIATTSL